MTFNYFNQIAGILTTIIILQSCQTKNHQYKSEFELAQKHGLIVNEGFKRCLDFTNDWLTMRDPKSGLIPENLDKGKDIWNGHNSAADNYPFMVLTAMILDKDLLQTTMLEMLASEKKRTSRLGTLTDDYSFSKQGFNRDHIDTASIIFSSSEYVKDGLIPLTEYGGKTPWRDRMFEILDDLHKLTLENGLFNPTFFSSTKETEVYGELLQILTRCYWMTRNEKYLDWAILIGDHYLIEKPERLLEANNLKLRDHGCEIIGGLSELYATVHFEAPEKKAEYQQPLYKIMDRVLELGRNEDGMFYNEININNGDITQKGLVDNWGYIYNAYYTVYLIDDKESYREAVISPFKTLKTKYHNYNWERYGADGFADAIESGINLYNRESDPDLLEWIDEEVQIFWSIQDSAFRPESIKYKNRGIIEGWHGDGNFARTTIMYCLMKTNDITIEPWRGDVIFGSILSNDTIFLSIKSEESWTGTFNVSSSRKDEIMQMPLDYPRINQFAQWYDADPTANYTLINTSKDTKSKVTGKELIDGIPIELNSNEEYKILIIKD